MMTMIKICPACGRAYAHDPDAPHRCGEADDERRANLVTWWFIAFSAACIGISLWLIL